MNRFHNQVAIVTGGADGLGKAIADRVASEGGAIALFDMNKLLLDKAVSEFRDKGYKVSGHLVDVASEEMVKHGIEEVETASGRIDIMVNSAGIVGPTNTAITEYASEAFDQVYAVNLRGSFLMTKYTIPCMKKANYGRILLIASIAGKEGNPYMAGYSATKAGVIGLVKGIGKEYAETGITINGLAPAVIRTAMNDQTAPEQLEYMTSRIPMKRLGTVDEVASLAAWIVSKESSFNTGFIFDISGGRATY
jgi:NAD(P)-dependent dehydrogenase (short-subunit alcohol dehydrogenase family)